MSQTERLADLLEKARRHQMTPAEKHAQRVSMIMGLRSDRSTLTREKVEEILEQIEGTPLEHTGKK